MIEAATDAEQRIAALSPEQRELLLRRLRERSAPASPASAAAEIPSLVGGPFDLHEPRPLGDVQAAFWMGGSGLYDLGGSSANVYVEYEFAGQAGDLAGRLNPVLAETVARHPMLRTVVSADGMQRVLAEPPHFEVEQADLSLFADEEIERHLESSRERLRYSRHPADRWPLFDMVVFQLPEEKIRYQARFDAMLIDGTSRTLLIDELIRGVLEQGEGVPQSAPPAALEVTYLDFLRALQAFRDSATWQRCRDYWLARLPSLPPAPRLPLARDFGPDTVPRIVWRNVTDALAPGPWASLCRRAAQRGITPTGIATALLAETLRTWSEEPSFTLGLAGAYYPPVHPQIRQVIGTFTTLYLLEAGEDAGPFEARARRLQERLNTDLDHQHFSGNEVLRELNRARRSGGRATLLIQFTSLLREGAPSPEAPRMEGPQEGQAPTVELREIDLMIAMPQVLLFWVLGETADRSLFLISQAVEEVFPPDLVTDLIAGYSRLALRLAEDDAAWSEPRPLRPAPAAGLEAAPEAPLSAAREIGRLLGLGPDDRLLSLSLSGSELALAEIEAAREADAAAIVPAAGERTPEAFAALATRERATVWCSTPALLEAAVHKMENDAKLVPRALSRVLLHRDRVPAGLPARLRALGLDVKVFATWGTEGAPIAAAGRVDDAEAATTFAALSAAAGQRLDVLDRDLTPRPAWVAGDLHLGGGTSNAAIAPTGERARRLPDGRIELLGHEPPPPVEALGYGADPLRVEIALQRHPGLRHAVVAWRGTEGRLVAWVLPRSPRSDTGPADEALRDHLRATFPEHLLPSVFVRLNELPLNQDGHVDRSALAVPTPAPRPADAAWTPRETELASFWEDVLGSRPAAPDDDFYALGGNSLLATRLVGQVAARFGLERPLARFLDRPTLAGLAEAVDREQMEKARRAAKAAAERPRFRLRDSLAAIRSRIFPAPTHPSYGMRLYLVLWLGQLLSTLGTSLGSFSLGVWVYEKTGSATSFAMIAVIAGVITLVLAPISGALADRWDRRKLMLFSNLGSAVMTVALASLMFTGRLQFWHVYPFVCVMVVLTVLQGPALTASISLLVPSQQLARAAGMSQVARASTGIIGPFAAGILVSAIGYSGVIYIDCATFLFATATVLLVPIPNPTRTTEARQSSILSDLASGWAYLREQRGLFALLSMYTLTNFCMAIVSVLLTPLILSFATPVELGSVNSAAAGGVLLGGLGLSFWGGPRNRVWTIFAILIFQGCLLFLGGVEPSIPLISLATFLFMITAPFIAGSNQAILQAKIAPEVQGRVFGIAAFIVACTTPLAAGIAGPLVDRVFQPLLSPGGALASTFVGRLIGVGPGRGVGLLFVLLGVSVLIIVSLAFLNPRLRRIETELPDAVRQNPGPTGAGERPQAA